MSRFGLSRRDILRTLTIGAGAASFAPPFLGGAEAAETNPMLGKAPRRILFVFIPNGCHRWSDLASAGASPSEFQLGTMTEPLSRFKKDLTVLHNLEFWHSSGDTHYAGQTNWLTGRSSPEAGSKRDRSRHISIDQYLGEKIGRHVTPDFPALVTSVHTSGLTHSYRADGSPVPSNDNPFDVYKRLFANLTVRPTDDKALAAHLARRKSVLDAASKDIEEFKRRLGAEDRARLDVQLESIRTLEHRLASVARGAKCQRPAAPAETLDHLDSNKFPELSRIALGNMVNAFACDLTRVGVLAFYARQWRRFRCSWAPVNQTMDFHGLSHGVRGFDVFKTAKRFIFGMVAEALAQLAAIPEGEGTMLDNTLVHIGSEIGQGHNPSGLTFLTIGGRNLGVRTGVYHRLGTTPGARRGGTPHTRMLVSFLHAMGLTDEMTFGDAEDTGRGPLKGFLAKDA